MKDGKHVILIVDDDQDVLDSLRILLEKNDYIVVEATTAEEGIVVYKREEPDLIIVDLMMEEVDAGNVLVKELKASGSTTPKYMLSSVGDSLSEATPYSDLGLDGVFQKPIDFNSLLTILKEKLGKN
jgi:DNA-binding response OmpR family regulator